VASGLGPLEQFFLVSEAVGNAVLPPVVHQVESVLTELFAGYRTR
jgi:hypothetical protein